jgi:hypothetical protein
MCLKSKNSIWKTLQKLDKRLFDYFMTLSIYAIVFAGLLLIAGAIASFYHFLKVTPHI